MNFTIKDVSARYNVNEHTVLRWIANEELESINVAGSTETKPRWRISEAALAAFEKKRSARPSKRAARA